MRWRSAPIRAAREGRGPDTRHSSTLQVRETDPNASSLCAYNGGRERRGGGGAGSLDPRFSCWNPCLSNSFQWWSLRATPRRALVSSHADDRLDVRWQLASEPASGATCRLGPCPANPAAIITFSASRFHPATPPPAPVCASSNRQHASRRFGHACSDSNCAARRHGGRRWLGSACSNSSIRWQPSALVAISTASASFRSRG